MSASGTAAPEGEAGADVLQVGQEVTIAHFHGTVRFLGETDFASGHWVGIELAEAVGKNNGTVMGIPYFQCPPNHGIFVRRSVVKPQEAPGGTEDASRPCSSLTRGSEDSGSEGEGEVNLKPAAQSRGRRFGVSAEVSHSAGSATSAWTPPFHYKDPEERAQLVDMVRASPDSKVQMMFGGVRLDTFEKVIDAMLMKSVATGEEVIHLGDAGDFFYIVKSGKFDILARRHSAAECAASGEVMVKVFEAGAGFAFGELALLYNAPRSATVVATQASEVWCLTGEAFRKLVVRSFEEQFKEYVEFLQGCDIFQELTSEQTAALAEVLEEEDFDEDEAILEQGDRDNKMFILRRGRAVACIKGDQGEVEVRQYAQGDYFGEIALLLGEPRKASVYATGGPATCIYITRDTFNRVLGPLRDFLQRNIDKYEKYQDAIASALTPETPAVKLVSPRMSMANVDEVFEGGAAASAKMTRMKRYRLKEAAQAEATEAQAKPVATEKAADKGGQIGGASEKEPASLAEKVAIDFQNAKLVCPTASFRVPKCNIQMFGGLRLGEKFTFDKTVVVETQAVPTSDGLEDLYSWKGQAYFKGFTHVAVLCQKGQKSVSDPTPNQDNYFVLQLGSTGLFGVCDGHGPFGHLVSFRLVQTLPHFLTTSAHFGKNWELCLKEAFHQAQQDLLAFCEEHDVNVQASGAAGSVLVNEGTTMHVAHIGDAGTMVASYNRRDSRLIFGTRDHKPQVPEERERLEAAGTEVREVDADNFRIYIRGTSFPGLTMSRAFGDTACAGVLQEPEYHQLFVQPGDEHYAIIASDGIWEFLDYSTAVDLTAKKLRLKGPSETVRFLTQASRKRWSYCCGDYCDDITVLLVQWNVKEKNTAQDTNYALTVTRHA